VGSDVVNEEKAICVEVGGSPETTVPGTIGVRVGIWE